MRLGVSKVILGSLSFGLRHVVAFYLLGLLVTLPTYLHSLLPREDLGPRLAEVWPRGQEFPEHMRSFPLPRPDWETAFAIPLIEMVLYGIATAVMVQTLLRDRQGKDWAALSALVEVTRRSPTILGVALLCGLASSLTVYLGEVIPIAALVLAPLYLVAALILCVAIPCAAVDNGGVLYCFERAAELTDGSRFSILAVYVLAIALLVGTVMAAAFGLEQVLGLERLNIPPLWAWIASGFAGVYFLPLLVIIHEALVALKEGPDPRDSAQVFD